MLELVIKDLMKFEGLVLKAYKCPGGKTSIGYGRNLEDNGISKKEAEIMIYNDIAYLINELDRKVNFWKGEQVNVRILLLQMAYQLGVHGLLKFKNFLEALKQKDYENAKLEILNSRWATQTPKRVAELTKYLDLITGEKELKQWKKDIIVIREFTNAIQNMSLVEA